jgi:hypothetical protein
MVSLDKSVKGICKVLQFANVTMYTTDTSPDEALPKLENSARELTRYLNDSGLQLAPEKCKLCIFKNKILRIEKEWAININGKMITSEEVIKFLGLYFEADLKCNHQVEAIRQKCIKSMAIISHIRTTWMGVDPTILLQLYTALIRSCIEYGGFVFHFLTKGQMDLLESIQCKAIRLAFGYMRMTPKNVMLEEANVPPVTFRLNFLGSNYVTSALSNPDHPLIRSLQRMARVQEDPTKVPRGKVPWIYTCYADIEPVDHLIAKDVRPLECSLPYQTLLVKGSISFKEGEEAKASPYGSNRLNEKIKDLENEAICYFTGG